MIAVKIPQNKINIVKLEVNSVDNIYGGYNIISGQSKGMSSVYQVYKDK